MMRIHKIKMLTWTRHIDLDHVIAVDPPKEGPYDYGFNIHLAFKDKPMIVWYDLGFLSFDSQKSVVDAAFKDFYLAWCGEEYEQDTRTA
jgi:hypothetical protein